MRLDGLDSAAQLPAMHNSSQRPGRNSFRGRPLVKPLEPEARVSLELFRDMLEGAQGIVGERAPIRLVLTLLDVTLHPDTTRGVT